VQLHFSKSLIALQLTQFAAAAGLAMSVNTSGQAAHAKATPETFNAISERKLPITVENSAAGHLWPSKFAGRFAGTVGSPEDVDLVTRRLIGQ
jgi:hypothetical protein